MMSDAEFDLLCAEYKAMHQEWTWRLGLQWWVFHFKFFRGPIPGKDEDTTADIMPNWAYQTGEVRVNIVNWEGLEAIDREETVAHELVHCLLSFLYGKDRSDRSRRSHRAEEHVTTTLARALLGRMLPPEEKVVEPPAALE